MWMRLKWTDSDSPRCLDMLMSDLNPQKCIVIFIGMWLVFVFSSNKDKQENY